MKKNHYLKVKQLLAWNQKNFPTSASNEGSDYNPDSDSKDHVSNSSGYNIIASEEDNGNNCDNLLSQNKTLFGKKNSDWRIMPQQFKK